MQAPTIKTAGPLQLVGVVGDQVFGERSTAADQWGQFGTKAHLIKNALPHSYGVCTKKPDGSEGFRYFISLQVSEFAEAPEGMEIRTLAEQQYAVFVHEGDVSTIDATCDEIDKVWRAKTELNINNEGDLILIEHYGPQFNPVTLSGDIEIWVPVKS